MNYYFLGSHNQVHQLSITMVYSYQFIHTTLAQAFRLVLEMCILLNGHITQISLDSTFKY